MNDCMGEENSNPEVETTKMFRNMTDEELAIHIIHKFNICRDTLETMPAFDEHMGPLFSKIKEK